MTYVDEEISSQPAIWARARDVAASVHARLPQAGERVAFVGCGTSWFVAMAAASIRESAGLGESDAFAASEFPFHRSYDRIIAISRSGTTSEIIELLRRSAHPSTLITAVAESPAAKIAGAVIELPFADERSVVQTRFATATLTLIRSALKELPDDIEEQASRALDVPLDELIAAEQCTFVATGWAIGLAHEAALKSREAAQLWSEAYPAMDYRHGPIAIAQPGRLVWCLGPAPAGLRHEVEATGAVFVEHSLDPLAGLIVAQRFAVALAHSRGLDPDNPRSLSRSVILDGA